MALTLVEEVGTATFADVLTEQTLVTINTGGVAIAHNMEWDCTALTKATEFRLYREIGGEMRQRIGDGTDGGAQVYTPGADKPLMFFWLDSITEGMTELRAQTVGVESEGASRSIPFQYGHES